MVSSMGLRCSASDPGLVAGGTGGFGRPAGRLGRSSSRCRPATGLRPGRDVASGWGRVAGPSGRGLGAGRGGGSFDKAAAAAGSHDHRAAAAGTGRCRPDRRCRRTDAVGPPPRNDMRNDIETTTACPVSREHRRAAHHFRYNNVKRNAPQHATRDHPPRPSPLATPTRHRPSEPPQVSYPKRLTSRHCGLPRRAASFRWRGNNGLSQLDTPAKAQVSDLFPA
jgi:hypothetical protein